jgi:hypothetical protein
MSCRQRERNPDMICASYKTISNRSTRLLLLEIVAEAFLKEHSDSIRETYGEGFYCECATCDKAREAMRLKHIRG